MTIVKIKTEPVELYKILKFQGLASSGGEAKDAIAAGVVKVTGNTETQKRKKIVAGDTIEFEEQKLDIQLDTSADS